MRIPAGSCNENELSPRVRSCAALHTLGSEFRPGPQDPPTVEQTWPVGTFRFGTLVRAEQIEQRAHRVELLGQAQDPALAVVPGIVRQMRRELFTSSGRARGLQVESGAE